MGRSGIKKAMLDFIAWPMSEMCAKRAAAEDGCHPPALLARQLSGTTCIISRTIQRYKIRAKQYKYTNDQLIFQLTFQHPKCDF